MKGTILGTYELLEELASGGMATVYVARHTRLGHVVAVKVLHPQFQKDELVRTRFVDEARIQANLGHSHILAVQDILELPEASGMVMELLAGSPLSAYFAGQGTPLPLPKALALFIPLVEALAHAHSQGVVHRDLKPSNIFLHCTGEEAVPKLMDFGIAKVQAETVKSQATAAGSMLGTPYYMAPEQFEDSSKVDSRADLFAVGVLLFEASLGRKPFEGGTVAEIMRSVLGRQAPAPQSIDPDLPDDMAALIDLCLVKDRDQRIQSAEDLLAELRRIADRVGRQGIPCSEVPGRDPVAGGPLASARITSSTEEAPQQRETTPEKPGADKRETRAARPTTTPRPEDSWAAEKWPKTHMVRKESSSALGVLVVLLILLAAAGTGLYFVWPLVFGEATTEQSDVVQAMQSSDQPAKEAGTGQPAPDLVESGYPDVKPAVADNRKQDLDWIVELPSHQDLRTGRWCEVANPGLAARVINARLQGGWRGHRLSMLDDPRLKLLGISVKEREDFREVRKVNTLIKEADRLAIRGAVTNFKTKPLSVADLDQLAKNLSVSPELRDYVEAKAAFLCQSLPQTARGNANEAGRMLKENMAAHSLDSASFQRLSAAHSEDRMVVSEINARAVCCLMKEELP